MLKKAIFLTSAALGVSSFMACSESDSVKADATSENSCSMISTEKDGIEISCGGEVVGHIKTSADKVYGASCNAEALKDDSGYRIVCGGDSVGVVYNGDHGRNGEPGSNGNPGTSCYAEKSADVNGYDVFCGSELIGYLYNGVKGDQGIQGKEGKDGASCTTTKNATTGVATITCTDGTSATIKDGANGLNGANCSVSEKSTDALTGKTSATITCGTTSIEVVDGLNGSAGSSCSVSKLTGAASATITCGTGLSATTATVKDGADGEGCEAEQNADGSITVTCGADEVTLNAGLSAYEIYVAGLKATDDTLTQAEWLASLKGAKGDNCSIEDNGDGTATITCGSGTGATTYVVNDGANGDNCSIEDNGDGTATITCGTGTGATTYTVNDGGKGEQGYGCSATSGTGYVTVKCQTGVDADDNAIYDEQTIYAAGYAACGDVAYNTTTQTCEAGVPTDIPAVVPTCGEDPLSDDQFCEADVAYDKADYWTEATSYPKADYGKCGDGFYEKASQFCSVYNKTEDLCGTKDYNPALQYCDDVTDPAAPVVKNISAVCGAVLYDVREQFCYDDGAGDKAYNKADYWDETTDYPVADYECPDAPDMSTCILK